RTRTPSSGPRIEREPATRKRPSANRGARARPARDGGTPRRARSNVALLLLSAPEAALRRLGQFGEATAPPRPRRPGPLSELGLGGGRHPPRLPRDRARPARPRRLGLGGRE